MRTTICRSSWIAVLCTGAALAPVSLPGQSSSRTHVVREGETLWKIAADSLGDAKRWREILQLNVTRIPTADQLVAGTRLILPSREPRRSAAPSRARTPTSRERRAASERAPLIFPSAKGRQGGADTIRPATPARAPERSIFYKENPNVPRPAPKPITLGTESDSGRKLIDKPAAVRVWEYVSAPFVVEESALRPSGRCMVIDSPGSPRVGTPSAVQFGERMAVEMLAGAGIPNGTRFLVARKGPVLAEIGQVIIPTGVVKIVSSGGVKTPTMAEVVAQFEDLSCDDILLGFDLPRDTTTIRPSPVANGPRGRVAWIEGTALLPSLQHAVIIDLGTRDGVKAGDQVTLMTSAGSDVATSIAPDVAIATVVRVSPRAATAIIIRQSRAAIQVGMPARVTAKLP